MSAQHSAHKPKWFAAVLIKLVCFNFIFGSFHNRAQADLSDAPEIFDVRRSLPLEPDDPVYHDFYINAGPEVGLKSGEYITVVRQVPVHDPIRNMQQATLNIKIARLQIIHVERGIAVGRLASEFDDDERPTVDFEAVMIGDRVDLASITTDNGTKAKKKARKQADDSDTPKLPVKEAAVESTTTSSAPSSASSSAPPPPEQKKAPVAPEPTTRNQPPSTTPNQMPNQPPVTLSPNSA